MQKKHYIIVFICCGIFLLIPPFPGQTSFISVFRVTEDPAVIVRGTSGSALTVNISFGDVEVEEWINELNMPYPLIFVDMDWAERFPDTIKLINEKNIPVGLLGYEGKAYEQNMPLFMDQLKRFENLFGMKPLWFRTTDEVFPHYLQMILWDAEVNALGSSVSWKGSDPPPLKEGEIISIPQHRGNHIVFAELKKLYDSRTFITVEDMLFGTKVKTKKLPK
ncbi:hypothetical protein [Sporosarcina limicola]|uniref:Uncharacterized protein n=1 Tax=Sporosarcina limicola TaxID=34101 RepID=A0A927R1S0_9BACL|nr:hypothetical protein [Sporosarcina limicola]MBE1553081.1 hypothetical protein [Sporosarcina limicola]